MCAIYSDRALQFLFWRLQSSHPHWHRCHSHREDHRYQHQNCHCHHHRHRHHHCLHHRHRHCHHHHCYCENLYSKQLSPTRRPLQYILHITMIMFIAIIVIIITMILWSWSQSSSSQSLSSEYFCCRRSHKSYRPLTVLTFRLTHAIFGLNPVPFHIGNLILHNTVTLLVHHIVRQDKLNEKKNLFVAIQSFILLGAQMLTVW